MRIIPLLGILGLSDAYAGETVCQLGSGTDEYDASLDSKPSSDVEEVMQAVQSFLRPELHVDYLYSSLSLRENITAPQLFSVHTEKKNMKVVYAPNFVSTVTQQYGHEAVFGFLAHDVGHFYDDAVEPPEWMPRSLTPELRADAWTGCALAKVAYPKETVEKVTQALAAYQAPQAPAWAAREGALTKGYAACGGTETFPLLSDSATRREFCEEESKVAYESCVKSIPSLVEECIERHTFTCPQKIFIPLLTPWETCIAKEDLEACQSIGQRCEKQKQKEISSCLGNKE